MRALIVTNMYPPHHLGGYELSCQDVVGGWRKAGHEVAVLTTDLRLDGVVDDDHEPAVSRELEFYWDDHVLVSPSLRQCLAIERRNRDRLRTAIATHEPEVISFWNMGAMSQGLVASALEADIPVVLVVCDDWLVYGVRLDPWARFWARVPPLAAAAERATGVPCRLAPLHDATVLFVSETTRQRAAGAPWGLPGRSAVTYSGISETDFPSGLPLAEEGGFAWRLLFVGRIDDRKGIDTAIRALASMPVASLDIVGPGDADHLLALRALASDLGVEHRVQFDAVARSDLRERYAAADVFVFPSVWDEPFGLVPLEAMACGTPVVATGRGGSGEFLADDENCILFEAGDPAALAAAVTRLAEDEHLRARLREQGRATAERFSASAYAERLERWHRAAADRFRDGVPSDR